MNTMQRWLFGNTYRMRRRVAAPKMEELLREEVRSTLCIGVDPKMVGRRSGITNSDQVPFCGCWWCRARSVLAEIDDKPLAVDDGGSK